MVQRVHLVIKLTNMKWIVFLILFGSMTNSFSQVIKKPLQKEVVEQLFKISILRGVNKNLRKLDLGDKNINKLQFYRYRVTSSDSIIFQPMIGNIKIVDNEMLKVFHLAIDTIRTKSLLSHLRSDRFTYIPLIILYQKEVDKAFSETIPISSYEDIFGWDYDTQSKKPEIVYQMFSPIIYRSPEKSTGH